MLAVKCMSIRPTSGATAPHARTATTMLTVARGKESKIQGYDTGEDGRVPGACREAQSTPEGTRPCEARQARRNGCQRQG